MATSAQVEQYTAALGQDKPSRNRRAITNAMDRWKEASDELLETRTNAQAIATDESDATAQAWVDGLAAAVTSQITTQGTVNGLTPLAQLLADLSDLAGLDGTANEIRLYKNGVKIAVTQDA